MGFLRARLPDSQELGDLYQETFLALHRSRHTYEAPRPVEPWFFAIAAHVVARHLRRRRTRIAREVLVGVLPEEAMADGGHARLPLWLALQTLSLGVAVEFGLRQDLGDHLRQPLFLLEVGTLVVAGAMAAAVALRGAVPGMGSGRLAVTVSLLLGSAAVALVSLEPIVTIRSSWGFVARGAVCVICILG